MFQQLILPALVWLLCGCHCLSARTYYLRPSGDDRNNGRSPARAWRTLDRANAAVLRPGDRLLLEGGATFEGTLVIDQNDAGKRRKPLIINSFGRGWAAIYNCGGRGILIHNTSGVRVERLVVQGGGIGQCTSSANGIECLTSDSTRQHGGLVIDSCKVSGFGLYGILVNAEHSPRCGFDGIEITRCRVWENGEAGIGSLAVYPAVPHRNFRVSECVACRNPGILTKTNGHSGNGIVLSGVAGALIEHCTAYGNGADNRSTGGGPVGIWVWNCRKAVIERCTSHHNYAGLLYDGGGFDLDGGSSDCVIRYCYSHDNEGAGYLLCEFGSPLPFTNNTVTHCESRYDGLKNGYGSITISGASAEYPVVNCTVSFNKVYASGTGHPAAIQPAALSFSNTFFNNIRIENNRFETVKQAVVVSCDTVPAPGQVIFNNNKWKVENSNWHFNCRHCEMDFDFGRLLR